MQLVSLLWFQIVLVPKITALELYNKPIVPIFLPEGKIQGFVLFFIIIVPDLTISYSSQCGFDLFEDCHIKNVFNEFILLW